MRFTAAAVLGCAALFAVAPARAQHLGERIPGIKTDTPANRLPAARSDAKPAGAARACQEYGPGFVRLEGSNTCVRAGGRIMYEYGMTGGRRSNIMPSTGSRAAFAPELETRTQTEAGPFRMVVRGVVTRDTGTRIGTPFR